jgi:CRP-like cAMP-binding protein
MSRLSQEDRQIARRVPLFQDLPDDAFEDLLRDARVTAHPRGHLLFVRGDPVTRFFVLLEGWVKVFRDTADGEQVVVAVMRPGESFAQAAIFTGRAVFPASAEVVDDARVMEIPAGPFLDRLRRDPDMALKLLGSISNRLVQLVEHIERLQFNKTPQRLAAFLIELAEVKEGPADIRLPYDKSLVAARLGMKPESLSRALAKLRAVGVDTEGQIVHVDDVATLRDYCQAEDGE